MNKKACAVPLLFLSFLLLFTSCGQRSVKNDFDRIYNATITGQVDEKSGLMHFYQMEKLQQLYPNIKIEQEFALEGTAFELAFVKDDWLYFTTQSDYANFQSGYRYHPKSGQLQPLFSTQFAFEAKFTPQQMEYLAKDTLLLLLFGADDTNVYFGVRGEQDTSGRGALYAYHLENGTTQLLYDCYANENPTQQDFDQFDAILRQRLPEYGTPFDDGGTQSQMWIDMQDYQDLRTANKNVPDITKQVQEQKSQQQDPSQMGYSFCVGYSPKNEFVPLAFSLKGGDQQGADLEVNGFDDNIGLISIHTQKESSVLIYDIKNNKAAPLLQSDRKEAYSVVKNTSDKLYLLTYYMDNQLLKVSKTRVQVIDKSCLK